MKPVANLVIEMAANVARLEKDMQAARRSVDGAMQKIQRSAQMAMRALGALGLGLGAAQLSGFVKQAINAGDRMQKLSQQIGVATENIAGLQLAFRQGGGSAAEMEMAVGRLVNAMNKQTDTFKKLNIQSTDTFGALQEVANIFQQMPDGAEKSALAYELFGRSGLRLIPILNQGAEGLQNYIDLSQRLGMAITADTAKQFERFNDTLDTVSGAMEGLAMQAATALVPVLQDLADTLLNLFTSGAVQRGVENLIEAMKLLGIAIAGRLIASVAGLAAGMVGLTASLTAGTAAMGGFTLALGGLNGVMTLLGGPIGVIATAAGALAYFSEQAYRAETTADGLAEKLGITNVELRSMTRIQIEQKIVDIATELQKLELQALETAAAMALLNETSSDPEAYAIEGGQISSELGTVNKKIASFQELLETLKNRLVETQQESSKTAESLSKIGGSAEDAEDKIRDLIRAYTDETDMMTMSNREKEYFLFLQKMEAEGIEGNTELWKELAKVYREAQADRTSVEAVIAEQEADKKRLEDRIEAEKEFAAEAQRINDQIGQSLTDALVEGGMNARDFLIKMFRTLVLRPLIQPIISGVLGAMGLGTAGAALAGGGTEGALSQATGLSGVISTLKGAVDMVTGGFAALGTSVSNLAVDAGFELMSMGFQDAGFAMIDASAALGTAASYLGGIAAGLTAGSMISGQFSVAGSSMVATGIGTAIGAAVGGPIGAAIGGAIGGVVNRAFGMGATTTEATGITGQMSLEGALAEQFTITKQKGGWFRSDKVRTSYEALEGDVLDRLSQTAVNVGQSVVSMAETLGLSAENLAGFNRSFILDFKGLSEEEINQRVQEEFGYFADALAETLTPELWNFKRGSESASQILTRLSGTLTVVNNTFDILGFTLYEASLAGADAAQKIIDLFGGVEQFTAATSFYYENFYSEQERANKQLEQMTDLFSTMGVSLPNTREGFRAMVEAAQAAGNPALVASLMQLAPAFDSLLNSFDSLRQSLEQDLGVAMQATDAAFDEVRRSLQAQLNASITAAKGQLDDTLRIIEQQRTAASIARDLAGEAISSLSSVFELLTAQIADLSGTISVTQTAMQARMFIRQALESARNTGYLPNADELSRAIGQARAGLGSEQFMTAFEQRRETLRLQNELIQLQELSGEQLTEAEKQLAVAEATLESLDQQTIAAQSFYEQQIAQAQRQHDEQLTALENQINELRGINTGIMSLADAMNALAAAIQAEMGARTAVSAATSPMAGQIAQVYRDVLERDPDPEGLNYWVNSGLDIAEATQYIIDSTENRLQDISKMYEDILGRAPDQAGLDYWVQSANSLQDVARYIEESPEARALRGFANGGYASPGMAIVGERGPELVDFQRPAMVYTNSELRNAMGGGDTAAELRQLRQETQAQSRAMVAMQARMTRVIEQWNGDGLPQERFEGATA